jgi:hypothetical protein
MSEGTSFISSTIEAFKEGREEARREQKARQLDYQSKLVENFNFSPREFYVLLAKTIEERKVPGLTADLVKMFESVIGSSKRIYMTVARERFVYYVCAAPYGSGFFFSWRLVDERRPGEWYHPLVMMSLIGVLSGVLTIFALNPLISALSALGFDAIGILQITPFVPIMLFLLFVAAVWSMMRIASLPGYERLAVIIERIPLVGRVFERHFRPDTYYRQDSQKMYQKVFEIAINETITSITALQGVRQRSVDGSPIVSNLHGK